MTGAEVVLAVVCLALAAALIWQGREHAAERKVLMEQFRAKARQDVTASLATSAIDFTRAEAIGDAIAERAATRATYTDEPPIEGFG